MIVMSTRFLLKNGLMCRKSTKLPMLEAQSFTTDFLRVNFTEFLSIFLFFFSAFDFCFIKLQKNLSVLRQIH